jgi:hypothetical protein
MQEVIFALLSFMLSLFGYLYMGATRDRTALAEYSQFLLLNPDSYAEQRRKFVEYLMSTQETAPAHALNAMVRMAKNQFDETATANVVSRNKLGARE